jgi:uncharacterized protein YciI
MLYNLHLIDDPVVSKHIRREYLDRHLAYIAANMGLIVVGGALIAEDGQTRIGSAFILNVKDREVAEAFSRDEPFRKAGLYQSVSITRMRRGQWMPENGPDSPDG